MNVTTRIYDEPFDRDRRLRELLLDVDGHDDVRFGLLEVVRAIVAGRANSTDNNSKSSPGYNAWDYGVRRLREVYRGHKEWERFDENGLEGIINRRLRVKITPVSTDSACDSLNSPRNRTKKGPATEKVVDLNAQAVLFPMDDTVIHPDGFQIWELCVADDGNRVSAELSLPVLFSSNYFIRFSERVFLVDPDEWERIRIILPDSGEASEFDPAVRRK